MPTNPLWLEHTEKAAWDTVQTLRQQIETERARVQQLVRIQQSWPRILQALADAKANHALAADDELGIVERLSAELARLKRDNEALVEKLAQAPREHERARVAAQERAMSSDRSSETATLEGFVQELQDYANEGQAKRHRSQERLLAALEDKLEELEQAPRRELASHAVEVAYLAFRVATDPRR